MTRINNTGQTAPPAIPSQDANSGQVSKPESPKTQESNAAEQNQSKQTAQDRKAEMDLHGSLKQSELAQFHGPGGLHGGMNKGKDVGKIHGPVAKDSEAKLQEELTQLQKEMGDMLQTADKIEMHSREKAAQKILDTYLPKKESNSSKKAE